MKNILEKAKTKHILDKEEIVSLLSLNDASLLFNVADEVRKKYVGDEVHLRALIEFSNICKCNCFYCGLRSENKNIERFRLSKNEILFSVKKAYELGYRTVVLQSGEDAYYNIDYLTEIVTEIKKYDIALTLSIGECSTQEYKILKECGVDRFLLRIETTDRNLYEKMHPNMSFDNRLRCLKDLKNFGYQTGTGVLVGLPEQTLESLANDILFFKKLDADMIGIGPLIIHPQTPLKCYENGSFDLALKVMAITRLLLPDINIPATTAMETIKKDGQLIALQAGANVIMPSFSGCENSKKYEIYPNKSFVDANDLVSRENIEKKINSIGRKISKDYGHRVNKF